MNNSEISLGTAQFGSIGYGITNKEKLIGKNDILGILELAYDNSIRKLDTAGNYGVAEDILGSLGTIKEKFQICTKIKTEMKGCQSVKQAAKEWDSLVEMSLKRLKVDNVETILIHSPNIENEMHKEAINYWLDNSQNKYSRKMGTSIYKGEELNDYELSLLNEIQLPISLYNQVMNEKGIIRELINEKIEVSARSIFMQGLIITDSKSWPQKINQKLRMHHEEFESYCKRNGNNKLYYSLGYIRSIKGISTALIGVTSIKELKEIIDEWNKIGEKEESIDYEQFKWKNQNDMDPRLW